MKQINYIYSSNQRFHHIWIDKIRRYTAIAGICEAEWWHSRIEWWALARVRIRNEDQFVLAAEHTLRACIQSWIQEMAIVRVATIIDRGRKNWLACVDRIWYAEGPNNKSKCKRYIYNRFGLANVARCASVGARWTHTADRIWRWTRRCLFATKGCTVSQHQIAGLTSWFAIWQDWNHGIGAACGRPTKRLNWTF